MHSRASYHAVELVKAVVPDALLRMRSERRFFAARNGFQAIYLGKFPSFAESRNYAASMGASADYFIDHREWAAARSTIRAHDYPVLYWLGRLLETRSVLVDLGGSVGVCYYNYRDRLEFPPSLAWVVCELPEAVAVGREIALERCAHGLSFTTDRAVIEGSTILISAGALQYIETPLAGIVSGLKAPPRHILVNKLALCHDMPAFVTLEHSGYGFSPARVDNFDEFVGSMNRLGYRLEDCWKCLEHDLHIPLHEECRLEYFHGMYFLLQSAAEDRPDRGHHRQYDDMQSRFAS